MTNKLNLLAVEKYSKSFTSKICDEFFSSVDVIDGKQILHLTSFQQVNLLTIKALYEKWQAETQRLRSPYFNYEEPEVQAALKQFMNVLSQHITVKRDAFEPLLIKATQETLWLALQPQKFFSETFRDLPNFRLTPDELDKLGKYVQINHALIAPLAEKISGSEFVFANRAIDFMDEIVAKATLEEPEQYLDVFSDILPIPEELFAKKQADSSEIPSNNNANDSFFDKLLNSQEPVQKPKEKLPTFEPLVLSPLIEPKTEVAIEPIQSVVEPPIPEPIQVPIETPKLIIEEVEPIKVVPKEPEDRRLNEHLGADQKTLNDQVTSNTSVLDLHKSKKIEEISHAISLNQRFLFINNLFNGNPEAYSTAIHELSQCENFPQAKEVLLKKYVPKYLWDITSAEAEEFIDIVRRRFS